MRTEDCPLWTCANLNPTLGFACHLLCTTGTPSAKPIALLLGRQLQKEALGCGTIAISPTLNADRVCRTQEFVILFVKRNERIRFHVSLVWNLD